MSASQDPDVTALADEFPISPDEAEIIAEAITPLQNVTGSAAEVGKALDDAPGPGPQLAGALLQNVAAQVNLASTSFETLARAMKFYAKSQTGAVGDMFPPPEVAVEQAQQDVEPLMKLFAPGDQDVGP